MHGNLPGFSECHVLDAEYSFPTYCCLRYKVLLVCNPVLLAGIAVSRAASLTGLKAVGHGNIDRL